MMRGVPPVVVFMPVVVPMPVVLLPGAMRACLSAAFSQSRRCAAVPPELVSEPGVGGRGERALGLPVSEPGVCGVAVDWPGVGAGVGLVPLGTRLSVVPVPGVPDCEGKVNDCPGVGAGAGPVPLGTELPGVEVPGADVPGEAPVAAPVPVPLVPAPPVPPLVPPVPLVWAIATTALDAMNAAAVSAVSDLNDMRASPISL
jgi:hypothetical protein